MSTLYKNSEAAIKSMSHTVLDIGPHTRALSYFYLKFLFLCEMESYECLMSDSANARITRTQS